MLFHCSDETREKLMDEYRLTWGEFFEYTKPPICIIWKKDPVTGIPMFPHREDYTEEDLEKYAREDIEQYLDRHTNLSQINNNLREYYKITEEEMLLIIGYNTYVLDKQSNLVIRKEWIRQIEKYLRNKAKEPKFTKTLEIGNVKLEVSELSVSYLKEKLKLKKKEAERYLKLLNENFIINYHGARRREFDDSSASAERFIDRDDKEEIYAQVVEMIKKDSLEKISRTYLMRKLGFNYYAVSMLTDALVKKGHLEESKKEGTFMVNNSKIFYKPIFYIFRSPRAILSDLKPHEVSIFIRE